MGFVPGDKEEFLRQEGFEKTYESYGPRKATPVYPDGMHGSQTWVKWDGNFKYELTIMYMHDGKHTCTLYYDNGDGEDFSLRMLKSMIRRRVANAEA